MTCHLTMSRKLKKIFIHTTKTLVAACLLQVFAACNDVQNEFTLSPCFLIIDNDIHQDVVLASAMNPNAPGLFCTIRRINAAGADKFHFESSDGQTSEKSLNGVDKQRRMIIGYNNGLIVGFGNLSTPSTFYAYDRECPNCFDPNYIPVRSKPLRISTTGIATCNLCKRQYDLNNGGNIIKGDGGKKMTRYRASTTGPLGRLVVN